MSDHPISEAQAALDFPEAALAVLKSLEDLRRDYHDSTLVSASSCAAAKFLAVIMSASNASDDVVEQAIAISVAAFAVEVRESMVVYRKFLKEKRDWGARPT